MKKRVGQKRDKNMEKYLFFFFGDQKVFWR